MRAKDLKQGRGSEILSFNALKLQTWNNNYSRRKTISTKREGFKETRETRSIRWLKSFSAVSLHFYIDKGSQTDLIESRKQW